MGCVLSKKNVNDIHPNIFKVMNVDDSGNRLSSGQLEITDNDLIFHQQGKNPTTWPLRCLRRYGFDAELFSFESGRRCATGHGIYAFRCNRAEQLFNLLQSHIQVRNNYIEDSISHDLPLSPSNGVASRLISDSNYLEPRSVCSISNRLNMQNWSAGTGGVCQMVAPISPPPLPPKHNISENFVGKENFNTLKENFNTLNHFYVNVNLNSNLNQTISDFNNFYINVDLDQFQADSLKLPKDITNGNNYVQLDSVNDKESVSNEEFPIESNRLYMNIVPGNVSPTAATISESSNSPNNNNKVEHNYVNLESNTVKNHPNSSSTKTHFNNDHQLMGFNTKSTSFVGKVNYIVLDLEKNVSSDPNPSPSSLHSNNHLFESNKPSEGYATIDFDRTNALSNTAGPNVDNDSEGCRKTRHHSTVTVNEVLLPLPRMTSSLSD